VNRPTKPPYRNERRREAQGRGERGGDRGGLEGGAWNVKRKGGERGGGMRGGPEEEGEVKKHLPPYRLEMSESSQSLNKKSKPRRAWARKEAIPVLKKKRVQSPSNRQMGT